MSNSSVRRQDGPAGVRAFAKPLLGAAAVAGLANLAPAEALADVASASATETAHQIQGLEVIGAQARVQPSSPKYAVPARDIPQTITVIGKELIQSQNLLGLRDVLSTVPGITFGAGEGGGGYGDSITLRGYAASADITLDGVRDSAQYSRSDLFNIEQVEVVNGASSVYSGAGSVGGNINLVSKTPTLKDSTAVGLGGGTAGYARGTVDANLRLADAVAVRLNAMAHRNDVPGRKVELANRWGLAPSIAFGLGAPTTVTVMWLHQQDDNIPQYGVPFYNGRAVPGVDPSTYYGYGNIDRQKSRVDAFTAILRHEFSPGLSVRNLSRYQEVWQRTIVDPPQGAYCLAGGLQPAGWSQTAAAINPTGYTNCATPGVYAPSGPRGNLRESRNTELYNQTDFTWTGRTGPVDHTVVVGASFLGESFDLDTGNVLRNPGGATPNPALPPMSVYDPDTTWRGPYNYVRSQIQDGERRNQAVYAFDTLRFGPHVQLTGGVRYEHNEGSNRTDAYAAGGAVTPGQAFVSNDDLVSYRVGGLYKPVPELSLYLAYGNARTPSQTAVNGACTAATCNVKPETAVNYEAGVKWDARGGRLSLTGAVFRNERSNYRVASGDPTLPDQVLDGASKVDGVTLGAVGRVTARWDVYANYTYLTSEVLQGASDFSARGGVTGTERDFTRGDPLTNVPDHAFSLWSTYAVLPQLDVGYGATYQGRMYLTQHAGIAAGGGAPTVYLGRTTLPLVQSQPYWVHRVMATWHATSRLDVQLNVNNLFDQVYYTRIRNNGWATPGDRRAAVVTASYRF